MSQAQRALGFLAATVGLALAVAVLGPRLLGAAAGPEAELVTHLKTIERTGLSLALPGVGTLYGTQVGFQRISVTLDADGQGATVTSTLDFTGNLAREGELDRTRVSSLGLERARYRWLDGAWAPESSDAPRLSSILSALEARRRFLDSGDLPPDAGLDAVRDMTRRVYTSEAWYVRSERGEVLVSEDYRLEGDLPDRPVDERGTRRLTLVEDTEGMFNFPGPIM